MTKKLDLHTVVMVMMSLNGWGLLPKEKNDMFYHRLITNNKFCSQESYLAQRYTVISEIGETFSSPVLRTVHTDINIDDVF